MFDELMARFRALSLYYQYAHWTCKGSFFFQDHLLFERLYNDTNDHIDEIAEKGIAVTGTTAHVTVPAVLARVTACLQDYPMDVASNADLVTALLRMEKDLGDWLGTVAAAEQNAGVRNQLEGYADAGNQRMYLLQQRLRSYDVGVLK